MSIPIEQVIDIRELRIGNYLEYDGKIVHVTMLSMDIDNEYEEQICFCELGKSTNEKGDWNRALADKLKRIPITTEWLIKFGFEQGRSHNECLYFSKKGFNSLADYGAQAIVISEKGVYLECGYYENIIDFDYVHQLQNLYLALENEELTISP